MSDTGYVTSLTKFVTGNIAIGQRVVVTDFDADAAIEMYGTVEYIGINGLVGIQVEL